MSLAGLEGLLVVHLILGGDLEALLCRVQDGLDLLDKAVLLLLQLGILVDGLLDEKLNVSELAEVKVTLPLEACHCLLEGSVLLLKGGGGGAGSLGNPRATARGTTCSTGGAAGSGGSGGGTTGGGHGTAFSSGNGVVLVIREVEVPEALCPLQELEVVLHLALDEGRYGNRLVDLVLQKAVC